MQKFTGKWRGKVRVYKQTRGDGHEFYIGQVRLEGTDGFEWKTMERRTLQTGQLDPIEFDNAAAAMETAQRVWTADYATRIVKTEKVFP